MDLKLYYFSNNLNENEVTVNFDINIDTKLNKKHFVAGKNNDH